MLFHGKNLRNLLPEENDYNELYQKKAEL